MEIKTVSIIGLGALGALFGELFSRALPSESLRFVAGKSRIARYRRDGVLVNGKLCHFNFVPPDENCSPADLLLIAVKFNDLTDAVRLVQNHVGPNTVILSLLNGISSEKIIAETYGMDKLLLCVAQGMDAVKTGNRLTYSKTGLLSFGSMEAGSITENVRRVERFFKTSGIPHEIVADMPKRMWSKFMLNVGANQTSAVYRCDYTGLRTGGAYHTVMVDAMREVTTLAEKEGVTLTEEDISYWLRIIDSLSPEGKTSMQQDAEAGRRSEVEMFSGTVLALARKHRLELPVNSMLYTKIRELENSYPA